MGTHWTKVPNFVQLASLTDPWNDLKIGSTIEFFPISKWSKKLYARIFFFVVHRDYTAKILTAKIFWKTGSIAFAKFSAGPICFLAATSGTTAFAALAN